MRKLGELQQANRFTGDQLVRFLNASVTGVPTLRNVLHINKATRKAAGNQNEIKFDEYVALLLDQASVDDVAAGMQGPDTGRPSFLTRKPIARMPGIFSER